MNANLPPRLYPIYCFLLVLFLWFPLFFGFIDIDREAFLNYFKTESNSFATYFVLTNLSLDDRRNICQEFEGERNYCVKEIEIRHLASDTEKVPQVPYFICQNLQVTYVPSTREFYGLAVRNSEGHQVVISDKRNLEHYDMDWKIENLKDNILLFFNSQKYQIGASEILNEHIRNGVWEILCEALSGKLESDYQQNYLNSNHIVPGLVQSLQVEIFPEVRRVTLPLLQCPADEFNSEPFYVALYNMDVFFKIAPDTDEKLKATYYMKEFYDGEPLQEDLFWR